jgi:hypothetical protein
VGAAVLGSPNDVQYKYCAATVSQARILKAAPGDTCAVKNGFVVPITVFPWLLEMDCGDEKKGLGVLMTVAVAMGGYGRTAGPPHGM